VEEIKRLFEAAKARATCHNIRLAAVIETPAGEYVSGWNGPPGRAGSHPECLLGGPITPENLKNCPSVHAEVRAICRAAGAGIAIRGGTIYLSEWFPCAPCALAVIEAGISRLVITEEPNFAKDDCYNFVLAREYLEKAGVIIEIRKDLSALPGRR
jgi:deoxycytidylate deaminase